MSRILPAFFSWLTNKRTVKEIKTDDQVSFVPRKQKMQITWSKAYLHMEHFKRLPDTGTILLTQV